MTNVVLNQELKGVEIYFDSKPIQNIIDSLKGNGYRWHSFKKCWYAKQNTKTLEIANKFSEVEAESIEEVKSSATTKKQNIKIDTLWNRLQFAEGSTDTSKYRFKFVGSNYSGLTTKETAVEIRKHLKFQFPEVKFSITSDHNHISITIKQSPYNHSTLAHSPELRPYQYREFEAEHNKELNGILDYCQKLLDSYNYDDSDTMSDYFNTHYYDSVSIDHDYKQTEQTEEQKAEITNYREMLEQAAKDEEERKEAEYQEQLRKQEEDNKAYQIRMEQEKKDIQLINNSINAVDLEENKQYYVIGSQFAKLNKNNTLDQYREEVAKGEYDLQNVKITKEIHFTSAEALNYFSNLLLNDFDFLTNTGGSFTDDVRINSMTDYYNMTEEEQDTVNWNRYGVAVYYNNQLQFVVDAQGYSYARYVGLVDGVTVKKNDPVVQLVDKEQIAELKQQAEALEDYSTTIITDNNLAKTWDKENWSEYKELMKQQLKVHNIRLTKAIIQQLDGEMDSLKSAMYKLLTEVDGIQDQFTNVELQQGQKLTLFYISDWGGIIESRIILDKVENTKYAQYNNAVKLTFKPEGKRTMHYNYFYSTLLVYDGWLNLPEDVLHKIDITTSGMRITQSKFSSCDNKQYDAILEHFAADGIKPIVNTYKPMF